jgi:hypothetical protein
MSDLLGELQDQFGYLHHATLSRSVGETSELKRIRDAERRVWQDDPALPRLTELLTRLLKHTDTCATPCPPRCKGCEAQALLPRQAAALREAYEVGGVVAGLRAGAGKTLLSLLLPTLLKAERAVLIVPASLHAKTISEGRQYSRHWRTGAIKVVTYEWCNHPNQLNWFKEYQPDLVVADESQKLKDASVKTWKRLARYAKLPESKLRWFVPMSGSLAGRTIRDYWHYIRLALKSRAPVPKDPFEAKAWAYALDEKVPPDARFEPGALLSLAPTDAALDPLTRARHAYRSRFTSSRGIIFTADDVPPVGLSVSVEEFQIPQSVSAAIKEMRETWETPSGRTFDDPLSLWRHCQAMGCFGFYEWDPPPPEEWLWARKAWHKYCREALKYSRSLDSKVHLIEEIQAGTRDDCGAYAEWQRVKPLFKDDESTRRAVWMHDTTLTRCADWLAENPKGICWVAFRAFGERLSQVTGIPYFRAGGLDGQGRLIDEYEGGPAIASVKACMEGHNLQQFSSNLLSWAPSKGPWCEQILARTHREGQQADEVTALILLTCKESYQSLAQSLRDAKCIQDRDGQPQRLWYSQHDYEPVMNLVEAPELYWQSKGP